ncbi:hypothetical protein GCK72_003257 [Caenorhabditis remanei]|uniref:Sdz-33 F-box domain-containing protein n=1 Tax=Caenorhabditis remanei TaxID=31234 RepID=A0A6A5HW19_CAERE|nr:hypothetical protein GCK72_003257 [Caenorhabditis remanei]KAF1771431.1 hypothetical protein GCK72_003257 [Caenorhabditis remanei]
MSLSKPFPLLRLPRLPLFKVFNGIGVREQFYLSICSSKAKYAIKFYNDRQKFSVTFHFKETFAFSLKTTYSEHLIDVQTIFLATWTVLSSVAASSGTSCEKNVKRLLLVLVDVFNIPAISLNFEERPQYFVIELICFVHSLKLKIQSLKIKSEKKDDKIVEFVLDNRRDASEVHLEIPTTTGFVYQNKPLIPKFNFDKLTINYAEWVTTWHLTNLFINCKHLVLCKCSTVHIDVNQFIKEWANGSSQLRWASLTFDDNFFMSGIMRGITWRNVSLRITLWGLYIHRVYRIEQQKTGREAYVFTNDRTIVISDSIFNLSICSTKAKNTIKAYTKRFKYSTTFYFQENFTFSLGTGPGQNIKLDVKTHKDLFKSLFTFLRVSTVTNSTVPTSTSWTRFENDVKLFLLFLIDDFHNPAVSLKFKDRRDVFVTGFIEFMNSQNLKIHKLKINSKNGEDKVVEFVMDHARHVSEVHLGCLTTSRFEYPNRCLTPKFKMEILRINHAEWVTTWHLTNLFINCKRLTLLDCTSSNLQLNLFFKKWITTPSRLQYAELQCYSPSLSLAGIMTGVPAIRLQRAVVDDRVLNHASYLITQQKTGVKALVYWHRFITLTTDFEL